MDLDLIERAGRRAGLEVRRFRARDLVVVQVRGQGGQWRFYDPLHDDADCFRLMVACDVPPLSGMTGLVCAGCVSEEIAAHPTRLAAVRRAVVRAAARDFEPSGAP
ncbi:hypothetical protein D2917_23910 [Cupriavidus oxalaticus]|uniref:Uncharacterized protein n=2 Tax=Cupriavidus oxalaticus TaxID=96344 RepID=A0A5P3VMM7_9BURK|nr:hypothetical protein D2917_23910 [Cupriavidus oxalaticus]